ncbi:MAG: 2-dehydropantoate 2-reductase, partial [Actinomycetota bacterium]|nr:2-dehydropantoate 2-reductase [Actinomycetota bacterium]MDA8275013.1 2-dehydropantoate 2-reductase [Actinomycetota bacterium]
MRIAVLGAGSLGSVIGGCLARGGEEVWLVSRRPEFVTAVSAEGLRLVEDDGTTVVWPNATLDVE